MENLPRQKTALRLSRATCIIPLILFLSTLTMLPRTVDCGSYRFEFSWISSLNIHMSFIFDGLSVLFILIISGIGFFITIYSADYLHGNPHAGRFFVFLHAFMLSMTGLVASDNMLALFVFWELTTIFSYLLIGFEHEKKNISCQCTSVSAGNWCRRFGITDKFFVAGNYQRHL